MRANGISAIVTGGASGLGAATGRALAAAGAQVALLDLDVERTRAVADEIGGLAVACDVSDADSAKAAVAEAAAAHGAARVLVNCAGVATPGRIVGKRGPLDLAAYSKVIGINLIGTFNLIRLVAAGAQALEPLEGGERSVIVSTASVAAYEGQVLLRTGPKGSGQFRQIGWDEALDRVVSGFMEATERHGSEAAWVYSSAGTMGLVHRGGVVRLRHAMRCPPCPTGARRKAATPPPPSPPPAISPPTPTSRQPISTPSSTSSSTARPKAGTGGRCELARLSRLEGVNGPRPAVAEAIGSG